MRAMGPVATYFVILVLSTVSRTPSSRYVRWPQNRPSLTPLASSKRTTPPPSVAVSLPAAVRKSHAIGCWARASSTRPLPRTSRSGASRRPTPRAPRECFNLRMALASSSVPAALPTRGRGRNDHISHARDDEMERVHAGAAGSALQLVDQQVAARDIDPLVGLAGGQDGQAVDLQALDDRVAGGRRFHGGHGAGQHEISGDRGARDREGQVAEGGGRVDPLVPCGPGGVPALAGEQGGAGPCAPPGIPGGLGSPARPGA